MAESNPTQVILTDDGLKIIKAQNTANEAAGNINDINSDNKLTPSEKLKLKQEYDKDVELYNIDIEQLKSVNLPTAELETAMSNLTDFVTPLFKEMNITSTINRDTLNSVFTAFATADKNASQAFVNMVQQVADDAKKAGDDAKEAGEKAQEAGEEAKASADQAKADATTAQNSAQQALNNITVVDSKVTNLSTSTTAQFNTLNNGYQEVISTVNNMDIGGRNIVLDSSNMGSFRIWQADGNSKLSDDKKEITVTTSHGGINIESKSFSKHLPSKDDTVVISAEIKGTSHIQFNFNDGNNFVGSGTSIAVTTEYKRYFTTFKWDPVNIDKAFFAIYATGTAEQYLTIKNVKIEKGNKATDWSPAPEDLASETDITASINNINLGVKNADGSTATFNMNSNTILLDANKIIFSGNTSIQDGTIGTAKIANAAINTAQIADGAINNAKIANAAIDDAKISNLNGNKIVAGSITANKINVDDLIANGINTKTLTSVNINTPNLNLGDNGQIIGDYSVNDDTGWFQPINGSGTLQISHGYIRSTANIIYYNKILNGIGGDKWGHWASSTQFVPAPDQAHPDTGNIAESTLTPAFLKLDIFSADKSKVNSRTYIDGTGLYINDGGTQAISAMLSDYELVSSGMAYLNSGIQMKQGASFTFGNLVMTGYHTIAMLDGNALFFTNKASGNASPIEIVAKTFTKSSRLSIKHDITPLSTAESSRLLNAIDVEKFRYTHDGATYKYQYGGVIDDVNSLGNKQYSMPPELPGEDGTGINLDSLIGILVKRVQDQDKTIGELSMRLTKLEMGK